jgi:hypothetical protein
MVCEASLRDRQGAGDSQQASYHQALGPRTIILLVVKSSELFYDTREIGPCPIGPGVRDRKPWLLVEVKNGDTKLSETLGYFQAQTRAQHAFQVVLDRSIVPRKGERLGAMLLADAVRRAYASAATVGSSMLVVDAINERAAAFSEGNGFVRLPDSLRLVLPMQMIQRLMDP